MEREGEGIMVGRREGGGGRDIEKGGERKSGREERE